MKCRECNRPISEKSYNGFCFRHEPKRNKGGCRRPLPRENREQLKARHP